MTFNVETQLILKLFFYILLKFELVFQFDLLYDMVKKLEKLYKKTKILTYQNTKSFSKSISHYQMINVLM